MRHVLVWTAMAGCWRGGQPPGAAEIQVRMAAEGEFPSERGSSDPMDPAFNFYCVPRGTSAPEQFAPIVAFAREHLVEKLDRLGLTPSSPVHARLVLPGQPEPAAQRGIEVAATPMSEQGSLEVANWWDHGGNSFHYCLHTVHDGARTVVVVEPLFSVIS